MAKEIIVAYTSLFIDYFRKQKKEKTSLFLLSEKYEILISVITKLEVMIGATEEQKSFWNSVFETVTIVSLHEIEIDIATNLLKQLKKENKLIGLPDVLIAATALSRNFKLSTLNAKHFERVTKLKLLKMETNI